MSQAVNDAVREFITENFYLPDPDALADDMSLLDEGIVDSTGILEVVMFLEETFEIVIEDDEMIPENFDTIGRIASFVGGKTGESC